MRTKGSNNITESVYREVKALQTAYQSVNRIFDLTGVGIYSQDRIFKSESWQDWQRQHKERAMRKHTTVTVLKPATKTATKKSAPVQNPHRKAQQKAVKSTIDANRLGALEMLMQAQGRALQDQRKILIEIRTLVTEHHEALTQLAHDLEASEDDKLAADIAAIPFNAPIRRWWNAGGKR